MLKQRLLINPSNIYDFGKNQAIRLSYAYASEEELEHGIEMLARTIRGMYSL